MLSIDFGRAVTNSGFVCGFKLIESGSKLKIRDSRSLIDKGQLQEMVGKGVLYTPTSGGLPQRDI